jgi:hypothetical protein
MRSLDKLPLAIALSLFTTNARADLYHFDEGTPAGSLTHPIVNAESCSLCHSGLIGDDSQVYGPLDLWLGSMHASAVRDPLFRAAMSVSEQDAPGIGSYCLRCHAPLAFAAGHVTSPGASNGSALDSGNDLEGVQCSVCHRSIDGSAHDPSAPYLGDARLFWDDGTPTKPPSMHGPFDDAAMTPAHTTVFDAFTSSPELCGQCHQVDNPSLHEIDATGRDTGHPMPLDTTYSEWSQSAFAGSGPMAHTCVDCHMPDQPGVARAANFPTAMPRDGVGRHEFAGGNEFGPALMQAAFPGFHDDAFARTRAFAQASLQRSASIDIVSAPSMARVGETIQLTVRVTNLSGHKLPTGFADGRRMWIALDVGDVTVSGAYAADDIVQDPQLRTYECVHGRAGQSGGDSHIARQNTVVSDTRIPPLGFVPTPTTAPRGRDYTGGAGGALRNDDVVTYSVVVPAGAATGNAVVRARLLFQSTTAAYVQALASDDHTDTRGSDLMRLWSTAGRAAPFEIAHASQSIAITAGAGDAGVLDGDATSDVTVRAAGSGCAVRPPARGRGGVLLVLVLVVAIALRRA